MIWYNIWWNFQILIWYYISFRRKIISISISFTVLLISLFWPEFWHKLRDFYPISTIFGKKLKLEAIFPTNSPKFVWKLKVLEVGTPLFTGKKHEYGHLLQTADIFEIFQEVADIDIDMDIDMISLVLMWYRYDIISLLC